jgi:hypothetical protein
MDRICPTDLYGVIPILFIDGVRVITTMGHEVIEDVEDREAETVVRRKIYRTDDDAYPSGYRYALHYGYTDRRGTILRYDNENQTPGRHERHTEDGIEPIDFPGMLELRDQFLSEIKELP